MLAPRWGRPLIVVIVLFMAMAAGANAAALGGAASDGVAAGAAPVGACDGDGFTVTHVLSGSNVTDVTVGGIDAACAGGDLTIVLSDTGDAVLSTGGPVVVPIGGGSVSVDVVPDTAQASINQHHLSVVGP